MSSTKKTMYLISAMSLVFMFTFFWLFVQTHNDVCYVMGITFMTVSYHLIVRLVIGTFLDVRFDNHIDSSKSWFEDSSMERAFYRVIGVKKWKDKLPTFDESLFSLKKHSLEDIIGASCQAEIVHEANIAASLLAILFAIPFGSIAVFIITSVLGALFDLLFVIIQRYNRPRLMRAAERQRRLFFEKLAYEEACGENDPAEKDSMENHSAENDPVENDSTEIDPAEVDSTEKNTAEIDLSKAESTGENSTGESEDMK